MNHFLDGWKQEGDFRPLRVVATIAIIFLSFFIGNLPFLWFLNAYPELQDGNMKTLLSFFGTEWLLFLQIIPFITLFTGICLANKFIHRRSFIRLFTTRPKFDLKRFLFGFLVWGGLIIFNLLLDLLLNGSEYIWSFSLMPFVSSFVLLLCLLPIQITTEELLFRTFLMQGFYARTKSIWFALILSGVMFGLVHLGNPEILVNGLHLIVIYIFFGLFLSYIAAKDQGIEVTMGFHLANNFISCLLVSSTDQALQTNAIFKTDSVGFDLTSGFILLFNLLVFYLVFRKMYGCKLGFGSNGAAIEKK